MLSLVYVLHYTAILSPFSLHTILAGVIVRKTFIYAYETDILIRLIMFA